MAVKSQYGQGIGILGELYSGYVAIGIDWQVHFADNMALDVECVYSWSGIRHSCYRIFVFITAGIIGERFQFRIHSFIEWKRKGRNLAFIKADKSNHLTVGTKVIGTIVTKFLFVHPIGYSVQYSIFLSVCSDLAFTVIEEQFHQKDVIITDKGNAISVR